MPADVDDLPPCRRTACGHPAAGHEHWRPGEECSNPGCICPDYLGPTLWARLREWWSRA